MKCPNDDSVLMMSDRQGIEIDYCPQCRGVWLDRGELDKIVERSVEISPSTVPSQSSHSNFQHRDEYRHEPKTDHYKKKKKENFLGDLFDF